jgi:hypothetical protein
VPVLDPSPLVRPPALPRTPKPDAGDRSAGAPGVIASASVLAGALLVLARGARPA